jgi:hypothetical protein
VGVSRKHKACMILVSMVWLVLLSLELFLRWDVSDQRQRTSRAFDCVALRDKTKVSSYLGSLVVVFLVVDTMTAIMLPALYVHPGLCVFNIDVD